MEITGSRRIPAPRDAVIAALDDVDTLRACIPGCERLERNGDAFAGVVAAKVGPVRADFQGTATGDRSAAPERLTLTGQGDAGASGSVTGKAELRLIPEGDETLVDYAAQAEVGGKIGQLGSRLITGFARKTADDFLANLAARLAERGAAVAPPPSIAEAPPLVHEEPADAPALAVADAPPLPTHVGEHAPNAIAPTAAPDLLEPEEVVASEQAATPGASAVTRIMLVAAIVVVIGAIVYYMAMSAPPV